DLPDDRILILVFDQVTTLSNTGLSKTMRPPATTERAHKPFSVASPGRSDIASGVAAAVEMLMEPAIRRDEQTALFPIDAYLRFRLGIFGVFLPHQGIAASVQHHHMRAGAVTMGFLIRAHFKLRDV